MAGFTTPDSILYRVQALLQQYHATELALIDTRNNGLHTAGHANYFTTPTIASADFQIIADRNKAKSARCVITDEGKMDEGGVTMNALATSHPSTMPRLDSKWRVGVRFIYSSAGAATEGTDGARLRCNRLALAGHAVIMRYTLLDIPDASPAVSAMLADCDLIDFGRAQEVAEDSINSYAVQLVYGMRLIESRA